MAVMVRPVCGFLRGLGSCLGWCDWRGIWQTAHLLRTMPCFRFGDGPWLAAAGRNVERCAGCVGLNYKNHILFGVACWIGVAACLGEAPRPASICAAGFAALLPDVDHSSSMLGRWVPVLPRIMPHRGLTHSAAALVGMAAVLWLAFVHFPQWPQLWLAAFVGYASGIAGDVLTRNGVQFLWPFKPRLRLPLLGKSGGWQESVFNMAAIALALYFWFYSRPVLQDMQSWIGDIVVALQWLSHTFLPLAAGFLHRVWGHAWGAPWIS